MNYPQQHSMNYPAPLPVNYSPQRAMNYPLQLSFELLAIARKISVVDATGNLQFFVKQKLLKLKESVTVFAEAEQKLPLYEIKADRVIDFSAKYNLTDARGTHLGMVKRNGVKSLWRARYDVINGGGPSLKIQEENPWTKVLD